MRNLFLYFPLASRMGSTQFSFHFNLLEAETLPLRNELLALIVARHVLRKLKVSGITISSNYYQIWIGAYEKVLYAFHVLYLPIESFVRSLLSVAASKTNRTLEVELIAHNGRWSRFGKDGYLMYPGLRADEARRSLNYVLKTANKILSKEDKQLFKQTVRKLEQLKQDMKGVSSASLYIPHRLSLTAVPIIKGKINSKKQLKLIRKSILINKIGILKSPKHNKMLTLYQKSRLIHAYDIQINAYEASYATNLIPSTRAKLTELAKKCFIDRYVRFEYIKLDEKYTSVAQVLRRLAQPENISRSDTLTFQFTYTIRVNVEFNC